VGVYQSFFERLFPAGRDYAAFRPLLEVIAAAREPLTAKQIGEFVGRDPFDVEADLQKLAAFFTERRGLYRAYHKSITDYLEGAAGHDRTYRVNLPAAHARIAGALLARRAGGTMDRFLLAHLPHHLTAAQQWDTVEALLTDVLFLEAKIGAGMAFELPSDFSAAVAALPPSRPMCRYLGLLEEAIRRDIHFIAGHDQDYPQALFQCLWNSCWWYEPNDVERLGRDDGRAAFDRLSLSGLLEAMRARKRAAAPGFRWIRSLRPPSIRLGSGHQRALLRGHHDGVIAVARSSDERMIASASADSCLRIWDATTGEVVATTVVTHRLPESQVNPYVWESSELGRAQQRIDVPNVPPVAELHFSADHRVITSAWSHGTIHIWDWAQQTNSHSRHCEWLCSASSIVISPDGETVAAAVGADFAIGSVGAGREVRRLAAPTGVATAAAFALDGRLIAAAGSERGGNPAAIVAVTDWRTGVQKHRIAMSSGRVNSMAFPANGSRLVAGSTDGTVRIWDLVTGREIHCLRGHERSVTAVAMCRSGLIASAGVDTIIRIWEGERGVPLASLHGHESTVNAIAFDAGHTIASGSADRTVRVWTVTESEMEGSADGHLLDIAVIRYSPDGTLVATGSEDRTVKVWDTATGGLIATFRGHSDRVVSLDFSPDGRNVVSCSPDGSIRAWDLGGQSEVWCFHETPFPPKLVAWSPDIRVVAVGTANGCVTVLDARTGSPRWRREFESVRYVNYYYPPAALDETVEQKVSLEVRGLAFAPSGRLILALSESAGSTPKIRVWDTVDNVEVTDDWAAQWGEMHFGGGTRSQCDKPDTFAAHESGAEISVKDGQGRTAAWFSISPRHLQACPDGKTWAAAAGSHLYLFALQTEA
jgi:WD40 repeat protein